MSSLSFAALDLNIFTLKLTWLLSLMLGLLDLQFGKLLGNTEKIGVKYTEMMQVLGKNVEAGTPPQ